ncbi:Clp protease N-terminal domain-containing protein [Phaeacidiphilus oryzae]|jgi:ATP-dependent Clp protease ATP-binding subunit ClpA|uniref:Clp protease N-terminal domain-containing protein n=1 Tax=Phaeacidiphilus oryzae TaxID=348818 RepID=UPI0005656D4D|nr:Clp protease N-terminal domain-containing protein [Phaeacidiphilus oryzae]
MLERFSSGARAATVHAREEARQLRHDSIGAEHLLLGLLYDEEDPAVRLLLDAGFDLPSARAAVRRADRGLGPEDAAALESIGIDLEAVVEKVEEGFGEGALSRRRTRAGAGSGADSDARSGAKRLRFDPPARKALERSVAAAGAQRTGRIEDGHLLLGLLDGAGPARRVVEEFGLVPEELCRRVRAVLPAQAG